MQWECSGNMSCKWNRYRQTWRGIRYGPSEWMVMHIAHSWSTSSITHRVISHGCLRRTLVNLAGCKQPLKIRDIYHTKYTRQLSIDPPVQTRERINWRRRTRQWRLICNVRRQVHFTKWDPVIYSSRIYCKLAARKKRKTQNKREK